MQQPLLVQPDLDLINSLFPYLEVNWNVLTWKIATLPSPKIGLYSRNSKTITLDVNHVHNQAVRFHELGHFIHHVVFSYQPIVFPSFKQFTFKEQFAEVFEDTLLRVVNKRKMSNDNLKLYHLIQDKSL